MIGVVFSNATRKNDQAIARSCRFGDSDRADTNIPILSFSEIAIANLR